VEATIQSVISLRASGNILNSGEVYWYINGNREVSSEVHRFISRELEKGDIVQAVIVNDDKEFHSNEIIIKNTPPVIQKARLSPEIPRISSIIKVDVKAEDIDGDQIDFKYTWTRNGTFVSEESILDTELKRGDTITVEVTPFDDEDRGNKIVLNSMIFNSLPVVSESKPVFDGKIYQHGVIADDPDGDLLTYKLEQAA
jgi:hypothetical protein